MAFLKAHIFLRIVKEGKIKIYVESSLGGINYSKKEKAIFDKHLGTNFPFYCSELEGVKW